MKALVIHGAEDLHIEDRPIPEPQVGEVRIRVDYVGVCGSDLHYYYHGANGENLIREPFIPGHELSGIVDLDPSGEYENGTRVTVHPARFGTPLPGLEGKRHLWPGGDYLGSAGPFPHRQGAAAEYMVVESSMLRRLPDDLPQKRAALAEPLGVALHAITIAPKLEGQDVLVLGAGPIGLLLIAALKHENVGSIVVGDIAPEALERAKNLGATRTYLATEESPEPGAFPVVFECSAAPVSLSTAVRAVAPAGVIVQVGMLANKDISVNLAGLLAKEAQLRGAFRFNDEIDRAIEILSKDDSFDSVITHVISADSPIEAFEAARDSRASAKVLIEL